MRRSAATGHLLEPGDHRTPQVWRAEDLGPVQERGQPAAEALGVGDGDPHDEALGVVALDLGGAQLGPDRRGDGRIEPDPGLDRVRIDAGADNQPYKVWSAPYDTIGTTKNGQYELGSGTSPTVLGNGDYVAITDNADPMKVVVYQTGEDVAPTHRVICQVPVFLGQPGQALSNSLIGSGLSLIASNNYNYLWDWQHGKTVYPSAPGFARIDIDRDRQRCNTIWTSYDLATTTSPRLSTKTGLIYTVARESDPNAVNPDGSPGVYVYYWAALDFRTGETVWKKLAGTGDQFDSFYPALAIGPDRGLYVGAYGGFTTLKDQPRVWCPIVAKE